MYVHCFGLQQSLEAAEESAWPAERMLARLADLQQAGLALQPSGRQRRSRMPTLPSAPAGTDKELSIHLRHERLL